MSIKKIFNSSIFSEICRGIVYIFIYMIINKVPFSNENIYEKKLEILSIFVASFIYAGIIFIYKLFKSPLFIYISILSFYGNNEELQIVQLDEQKEAQRTIKIKVSTNKGNSLWNKIALKILKRNSIKLVLQIIPKYEKDKKLINYLILSPSNPNIELEKNKEGDLVIDINNILEETLLCNVKFKNEYKFIVNGNRDNKPTIDQNFFIKPKITIGGKFLDEKNILIKFLINYKISLKKECFEIQYYTG